MVVRILPPVSFTKIVSGWRPVGRRGCSWRRSWSWTKELMTIKVRNDFAGLLRRMMGVRTVRMEYRYSILHCVI